MQYLPYKMTLNRKQIFLYCSLLQRHNLNHFASLELSSMKVDPAHTACQASWKAYTFTKNKNVSCHKKNVFFEDMRNV